MKEVNEITVVKTNVKNYFLWAQKNAQGKKELTKKQADEVLAVMLAVLDRISIQINDHAWLDLGDGEFLLLTSKREAKPTREYWTDFINSGYYISGDAEWDFEVAPKHYDMLNTMLTEAGIFDRLQQELEKMLTDR